MLHQNWCHCSEVTLPLRACLLTGTPVPAQASGHDKTLSKRLSWLLRHGAEKEGLRLLAGGFLAVSTVLARPQFRGYTAADVRRVVETNDKQRFSLLDDPDRGLLIRANQGHSLKVDCRCCLVLPRWDVPLGAVGHV